MTGVVSAVASASLGRVMGIKIAWLIEHVMSVECGKSLLFDMMLVVGVHTGAFDHCTGLSD